MAKRFIDLVKSLVEPADKIENALFEIYTAFVLPGATGAQLDIIGSRVGQKREGLSDADYKKTIRARVLVNRSTGSFRDVKKITLAFSDYVRIESGGGVAFIDVRELPLATSQLAYRFLLQAIEATVRLHLFYLTSPETQSFTFASAAITTGLITGNTVTVRDGLNLPDHGIVDVGFGTPLYESATYTSRDANRLYGFTAVNAHPVGTAIQQNNAAQGFGIVAGGVGGYFATIIGV